MMRAAETKAPTDSAPTLGAAGSTAFLEPTMTKMQLRSSATRGLIQLALRFAPPVWTRGGIGVIGSLSVVTFVIVAVEAVAVRPS